MRNKIIPNLPSIKGHEDVPIQESNELLTQLTESKKLKIAYTYFKNKYKGSEKACYVRDKVSNMLVSASNNLPKGLILVVNDGWRPYKVQQEIYKRIYKRIQRNNFNYTKAQIQLETLKFASDGNLSQLMPSPHFTGGAVDVTLADTLGIECNMGSQFDECIIQSKTRYFEELIETGYTLSKAENEALQYRRILFHTMNEVGFTNYSNEWWHFDYGNQYWGKIKKTNAIYGLIHP